MVKIVRKIISIDEEKCDGCGLCIPSCEEGALQIVDGKARLVKDIYCDGLGNCLRECPQGAIEIIEREADPFNEAAVKKHLEELANETEFGKIEACGTSCGSSMVRDLKPRAGEKQNAAAALPEPEPELSHWPVQLHLVNPQAHFLQGANLLVSADCVPFAHADFHRKFLTGKSLIIGCPKLDDTTAYHQKLVQIFRLNNIKSVTLVHMEVGCCFGLSKLVQSALAESGAHIPLETIIVGVDGSIKQ